MTASVELTDQDAHDLLLTLLMSDTEADVITALAEWGLWDDDKAWRYYGDREKSYSTVGNQQSTAEGALVEKVTNSVDAILMRLCMELGIDPKSLAAPSSLREAVAIFFDGASKGRVKDEQGLIASWTDTKRREIARLITMAATGATPSRGKPSITIADAGEGQSPENLPHTILSLDEGIKQRVPFVHGRFNMGGTGALRFCGQHNLQLVLSKRAPSIRKDDESDAWGFTIVRRERPNETRETSIYRYLAPLGSATKPNVGEVLRFSSSTLPIFPEGSRAYALDAEWGTLIKLYEFDTRLKSHILRRDGLKERLDLLLPGLALPVRLYECRYEGEPRSFETSLTGLEVRLEESAKGDDGNIEPGFPTTGEIVVSGQRIGVKIYAFKKDKARTYRRGEGIVLVIHGQTHTTWADAFFRRQNVGMGFIRDSILVVLDCSQLDPATREDLFMNSRDRVAHVEMERKIQEVLAQLIRSHEGLRLLRERRRQEERSAKLSNSKPLEDVLSALLRKSPALTALFATGTRLSNPFASMEQPVQTEFKGRPYPTFFKFKDRTYGVELKRNAHLGQRARLTFETDVANDYFRRSANSGQLTVISSFHDAPMDIDYSFNLHDGIAHVSLDLPEGAVSNDSLEVTIEVTDDTRIEAFVNKAILTILPPQAQTSGPGGRRASSDNEKDSDSSKQGPAGIAIPEIREVTRTAWNDRKMNEFSALRIEQVEAQETKAGIPAYDFYVNVDNIHLQQAEKAEPKEAATLKAQFIYGLVLVSLGVIKQTFQPPKSSRRFDGEDPETRGQLDAEVLVAHTTDAVAGMILPMIQVLGGITMEDIEDETESDLQL